MTEHKYKGLIIWSSLVGSESVIYHWKYKHYFLEAEHNKRPAAE